MRERRDRRPRGVGDGRQCAAPQPLAVERDEDGPPRRPDRRDQFGGRKPCLKAVPRMPRVHRAAESGAVAEGGEEGPVGLTHEADRIGRTRGIPSVVGPQPVQPCSGFGVKIGT